MVSGNPPPSPASSNPPHGEPAIARVILVGTTGLENGLRHDPSIELIRTRTALEALGELSDPIDDSSPSVTTVIVSRTADPGVIAPRQIGPGAGSAATEFVDSLRIIDPAVRVLLMGDGDAYSQSQHAAYDGVIPEAVPATLVRRLVRAGMPPEPAPPGPPTSVSSAASAVSAAVASVREETPRTFSGDDRGSQPRASARGVAETNGALNSGATHPASHIPGAPRDESVSTGAPRADSQETTTVLDERVSGPLAGESARVSMGAEELSVPVAKPAQSTTRPGSPHTQAPSTSAVDALLTGGDVLAAALSEVRARLNVPSHDAVSFVHADQLGAEHDLKRHGVMPVAHRGRHFGSLVVADAAALNDPKMLELTAAWLGSILALRQQQDQLREAAFSDELTGAYNRRYFKRFADAAIDQARNTRRTVTLLLFDVDDFKQYNDAHGHDAGDEILVEVVRLLNSVIRPTDRVCRIGGDEFVVVFNEPAGPRIEGSRPPQTVWEIAQRFQKQIAGHRFPKLAACAAGPLTVSGGLATFPWDGQTVDELLCRADQLAIESKRHGKNAITLGPGAERSCK